MSYKLGWGDKIGIAICWSMVALVIVLTVYDVVAVFDFWSAS
jgi:hypothetical protein